MGSFLIKRLPYRQGRGQLVTARDQRAVTFRVFKELITLVKGGGFAGSRAGVQGFVSIHRHCIASSRFDTGLSPIQRYLTWSCCLRLH